MKKQFISLSFESRDELIGTFRGIFTKKHINTLLSSNPNFEFDGSKHPSK